MAPMIGVKQAARRVYDGDMLLTDVPREYRAVVRRLVAQLADEDSHDDAVIEIPMRPVDHWVRRLFHEGMCVAVATLACIALVEAVVWWFR